MSLHAEHLTRPQKFGKFVHKSAQFCCMMTLNSKWSVLNRYVLFSDFLTFSLIFEPSSITRSLT